MSYLVIPFSVSERAECLFEEMIGEEGVGLREVKKRDGLWAALLASLGICGREWLSIRGTG